ncbi:MAG: AI-2E family transporter [Anaerolineae bacterium]|uniref:AI-2E family transporter n=1 Tax=Promineifilum sp. TaxID=2664178 RepID=UPI001D1E50B2|nr:AI-2E family transporter [Anaerolineales bacterium]MCB8935413.1 AI-2E family transporter [Promineifilum sp.]MCO5181563.1 AI-2E family transporter [Promineifilum sp.]MCW5846480.1 AI-2E family transporter [Anaerolineae bacterium]
MKRLAVYTAIIAATLALLILLWQFRSVAILLIISLVLTAALRPSVDFLAERGLRAGMARAVVYLLAFGLLGLGLYLISGPLVRELVILSNYLVVLYDSTYRAWAAGSSLQQAVVDRLLAPDQLTESAMGPVGAALAQLLFGVTQNAATIVAGLVIVIALSLYWSADRSHFERLWLSLLPAGRRIQARRIWQKTEGTMGAYLRSEVIQSVLAVILLVIGYSLIGNDYALLTGLLAGVAWLVPLVGFVFAALLSFLFGLASSGGLPAAVGALVLTTAVLAFLEFVVEPRLFRRNQFSGVLIIVVMVMMVDTYGLTGFLIAPPLAVAAQVLVSQIIYAARHTSTTAVEIDTLEERLISIQKHYDEAMETGDETMPREIASLVGRLNGLLAEARRLAPDERVPQIQP